VSLTGASFAVAAQRARQRTAASQHALMLGERVDAVLHGVDRGAALLAGYVVQSEFASQCGGPAAAGCLPAIDHASENITARMRMMPNATFAAACQYLNRTMPGFHAAMTVPSGVTTQRYPAATDLALGADLLARSATADVMAATVRTGITAATGPLVVDGVQVVVVVYPVYVIGNPPLNVVNATTGRSAAWAVWWGMVNVYERFDTVVDAASQRWHTHGSSHDEPVTFDFDVVISDALRHGATIFNDTQCGADVPAVIAAGQRYEVTTPGGGLQWTVHVAPCGGFAAFDLKVVTLCVTASIAASLAVALALHIGSRIAVDSTADALGAAPRNMPFVCVAVEIAQASAVWSLAPSVMAEVMKLTIATLRDMVPTHQAYEAQLVNDGMLIVCESPQRSLALARAINNWAACTVWPDAVTRHFPTGDVDLRILLHLCTAGTVRADATMTRLDYDGPDIKLATGLRAVCPRDRIVATRSMLDVLPPAEAVLPLGAVRLSDADPLVEGFLVSREEHFAVADEGLDLDDCAALWAVAAGGTPGGDGGFDDGARRAQSVAGTGLSDMFRIANEAGRDEASSCDASIQRDEHERSTTGSSSGAGGHPGLSTTSASGPHAARHHEKGAYETNTMATWLMSRACDWRTTKRLHAMLDEQRTITANEDIAATLSIATYFYQAYAMAFTPLAGAEQRNIFRRFQSAFGIPEKDFLVKLSVRCAIMCFQRLQAGRWAGDDGEARAQGMYSTTGSTTGGPGGMSSGVGQLSTLSGRGSTTGGPGGLGSGVGQGSTHGQLSMLSGRAGSTTGGPGGLGSGVGQGSTHGQLSTLSGRAMSTSEPQQPPRIPSMAIQHSRLSGSDPSHANQHGSRSDPFTPREQAQPARRMVMEM
jgi:hypothetical protein